MSLNHELVIRDSEVATAALREAVERCNRLQAPYSSSIQHQRHLRYVTRHARAMLSKVTLVSSTVQRSTALAPRTVLALQSAREALRRELQQASNVISGGCHFDGAPEDSLKSLRRTQLLLQHELEKVELASKAIVSGAETMKKVNSDLKTVDATLRDAAKLVRAMLRVKTVDDILLRLSALCFVVVVAALWLQRIFGLWEVRL